MALALPQERLLAIISTQSEIAGAAFDYRAVMALVARRARELTQADASVIELIDGDEMVYEVTSGTADAHGGLRLEAAKSLSGLCLWLGEILICEDAESDPRVDREACRRIGATSMLCVPLTHRERIVGVLKVYSSRARAFSDADVQTLDLLSGLVAASMAHADDFERHRHQTRHDVLTGLPNRRAFDERIGSEVARVGRYGGELSLALADLDGFKYVNDSQGHATGDLVLRNVAARLAAIRGADGAYRFGGAEFAVVFAGEEAHGATKAMYRLEDAVRDDPACCGVNVSWGVAEMRGGDKAELVARADRALYQAKQNRSAVPAISAL